MDVLKNKVEAYNECAKYLNSKVPSILGIFKMYKGKKVLTTKGGLLKVVRDRCNLKQSKVSAWFDVSPHSIWIQAKKPYPVSEFSCDYVFLDVFICSVDRRCVVSVYEFTLFPIVSVSDLEEYQVAHRRLGIKLNGLVEGFRNHWDTVVPVALREKEYKVRRF